MISRKIVMLLFVLLLLPTLAIIWPARVNASSTLVAAFDVSSDGTKVLASYLGAPVVLQLGALYVIVADEAGDWWYNTANGWPWYYAADAQYYTTDLTDASGRPASFWTNHFPAPDGHSFLQINGKDVNWGPFSNGDTGHRYTIYYTGEGKTVQFQIVDWIDRDISNNACHIPVRIYQLPPCTGAPLTIGFWKNHPDAWPVDSLTVGSVTYTKVQALQILRDANAKDATKMLVAQLIAAKLNVLSGAWCGTSSTIFDTYTLNASDTFLAAHPWGSDPKGAERTYALMLKDILDSFNNGR
jgi:hypothetical protein